MKRTPATLNLQQKVKDKVFYQALELLHDQDPKSMDKLNELIEENLKVRNSKPRNVPTARTGTSISDSLTFLFTFPCRRETFFLAEFLPRSTKKCAQE